MVIPAGDDLEDQHAVAVDVSLLRELPVDNVLWSHVSTAKKLNEGELYYSINFFIHQEIKKERKKR